MPDNNISRDCFDVFSPKIKEPTIQALYEYEKHYMELVKKYGPEINMIADMLSSFRREQETFYNETLPQIVSKLNKEPGIDSEMRKIWINRLTDNMDRSFCLSETLITDYVTKSIEEFKRTVNEQLQKNL